MNHRTRIAVVGCGSIGERHLRNLRSLGFAPIGIDPDATRRQAVAALGMQSEPSLDGVDVDAVLVCTPATEHARIAIDALAAGRDVFVEKPLAASTADARRIQEAVSRTDRLLAVGYNLRFEPALRALQQALVAGRIGRLLHARFEFGQFLPNWRPTRDYRATVTAQAAMGGGILLEASHELDLLRWLCGEWRAVTAIVRRLGDLDIDVEDTVAAIVESATGVVAEVHLDCLRRGYVRTTTCIGTTGTLEWDLRAGATLIDANGKSEHVAGPADPNDMYVFELQDFLARVRDRVAPIVGAEEGVAALELLEAMRASSKSGQVVRR